MTRMLRRRWMLVVWDVRRPKLGPMPRDRRFWTRRGAERMAARLERAAWQAAGCLWDIETVREERP